MARFQNKSRALDQLTLIPICPNSSNDGRLATTPLRSCTGNSSPMATRISITRGYRRLARYFPEGQKKRYTRSAPSAQKKQEVTDQRPQPPVLARQAMFLFLRRPEERSASGSASMPVDQAYELVQQFAHPARARAQENSSMSGSAV